MANHTELASLLRGQRFRLSSLGRERCPAYRSSNGVVVSRSGSNYLLMFDGRKTPQRLHRTYIEPDDGTLC